MRSYGEGRVVHHFIDCSPPFRRILLRAPRSDALRYKTHLALLLCEACKLAMHAATIAFCLERRVRATADGAVSVQSHFPEQMRPLLSALRELYASYGIEYSNPVYDVKDKGEVWSRLFELGLVDSRDFARRPLAKSEAYFFYRDQPVCFFGFFASGYSQFVYAPLFPGRRERDAVAYFREREGGIRAWVAEALRARGLDAEERARELRAVGPSPHGAAEGRSSRRPKPARTCSGGARGPRHG
jgi:hypothetical protein